MKRKFNEKMLKTRSGQDFNVGGGGKTLAKTAFLAACCLFLVPEHALAVDISDSAGLNNSSNYTSGSTVNITQNIYVEGLPWLRGVTGLTINGNGHKLDFHGGEYTYAFAEGSNNLTLKDIVFINTKTAQYAVFNVSESTGVTFDNLEIIGHKEGYEGNLSIWGGLIDLQAGSNLSITDSSFSSASFKTSATGDAVSGGAIIVQGAYNGHEQSVLSVENTTFDSISLEGYNTHTQGGVISNEGIIQYIKKSTFSNNLAIQSGKNNSYGGAITNGSTNDGRGNAHIETIANTTFTSNKVTAASGNAYGGAIATKAGSQIDSIVSSEFSGNIAESESGCAYGGAIYNAGTIGEISKSTFKGNNVITQQADAGGAIYSATDLTLSNGTTFEGNTVTLKKEGNSEEVINNDIYVLNGANIIITKSTSEDAATDEGAVTDEPVSILSGISSEDGSSELIVKDGAVLNLSGNNKSFTGNANINDASKIVFTAEAGTSYIGGNTAIAEEAALSYVANTISELCKVEGTGTINYSGTDELTFNAADNQSFTGTINAAGKQLNVTGSKTDTFDFGINIQSGKLNYTAAEGANLTLDSKSNVGFADDTIGAEAQFSGGGTYTLGEIANAAGNTVTFKNTTLKVVKNAYADGNYVLKDSAILDLADKETGSVDFSSLSSDGGKLSLDVDLEPLGDTPKSDVLYVNAGKGTLTLTSINVLNEKNNNDNGLHNTYTIDVIKGNSDLTLDKNESVDKWATSVYEYDVSVKNKSIIMTAVKASDENSLKAMNQYEGARGFQFSAGDTNPYKIGSDLGVTKAGSFTVNGVSDGTTSISSGGEYSFFDLQNETNLTISNVTITDAAKSAGEGAVINAINSDALVELNNVTLKNNSDINGKNDIYIEYGAKVSANASAINSGLAGSGTFNANNSTLSGKNDNFSGVLNVSGDKGLTFSQTDAGDSYINGTTNIDNSSVTLDINKSDTTAGKFIGTGNITKTGANNIFISDDNSNFTGNVNINNGQIIYNADDTKYFGGSTILAKDGGLKITTENGTELSKISGNGTLSKYGGGTLTMTGDNSGFNGSLNVNSGTFALAVNSSVGMIANGVFEGDTAINLQNTAVVQDNNGNWTTNPNPGSFHNLAFDNLTLNGNVGLNIDVDLKNTVADTISANTISGNGHFVLGNGSLNVISDSLLNNTTVKIAYGAIAEGNTIILSAAAKTVMGPIQKYDVTYSGGNLGFSRQGGSNPSIASVNPSVMASVAATQVGGCLTQLQTLQDGFFHMDRYTKYPSTIRLTAEMRNKNAIADTPIYNNSLVPETSQGMWVKPYTSFEKVQLKGGVGVSNVVYGALYGGDSDLVDLGHGYKGVISAFVGYNGAHQSYDGISMNQQGGTLGITGTLYKGNFFTGLTVSTGASAGEAYTQYGTDHFSMLTAGVANKTGYNWEIKEGKMIVQPSLFLGYTFVNTFDYTNSAGVRINSDPLNVIHVVPGLKVIGNLKNGWQPYAGVDMVWNIMGKTDVMANDVRLPQLSVKPYVQYGAGVQKTWGERFTAFFQTMIRNGGRNGIVLSAGLRWVLGKEPASKPSDNIGERKVVIKQLKRT